MKRDPFGKTIKRRNDREDKLWKLYRHKPADMLLSHLAINRWDAVANRNMRKELDRIRSLRHG